MGELNLDVESEPTVQPNGILGVYNTMHELLSARGGQAGLGDDGTLGTDYGAVLWARLRHNPFLFQGPVDLWPRGTLLTSPMSLFPKIFKNNQSKIKPFSNNCP